jgi:hypothetical protein
MKKAYYFFAVIFILAGSVFAQFSGGDGSAEHPYQIATLADLNFLGTLGDSTTGKYFKQTSNIDASSTDPAHGGSGFTPINFYGTYDGQGKTISGLYINIANGVCVGLFGSANTAIIKNLGLVEANVSAGFNVGALVGMAQNSAIKNCYSTGSVSGGYVVGGLVGALYGTMSGMASPIDSCFSSAGICMISQALPLYGHVGGLVGETNAPVISDSYSKGSINCSSFTGNYVGGLLGEGIGTTLMNCYSTGNITGGSMNYIGGIEGGSDEVCFLSYCYSTGSISGGTNTGGLVAYHCAPAVNCFWDVTTSGIGSDGSTSGSAGGTGLNSTHMKNQSTYTDWDFATPIWKIDASKNNGYPYLKWSENVDPAMPVELTSFTAQINDNKIVLNWQTATEVNNYGFEIQKSLVISHQSLGNWEKVGFVQGSGNSNSPKEYSFTDENPTAGKIQYRLKQIDIDGNYKYYSTIAEVNISLTDVNVGTRPGVFVLEQNYPNPFNPTTRIKYSIPNSSEVKIKVYNILGTEIATLVNGYKEAGNYEIEFNADKLTSGLYIYQITAGKYSETRKMILLR